MITETLIATKIIAAVIVFFLALAAGLFPIRFAGAHKHLLSIGDAFAGGVFLSAALIHMIPNAEEGFRASLPNLNYPLALLLITVFFVFLFLLEHGMLLFSEKHFPNNRGITTPYLLALLIMVHALLEGAAIGINTDLVSFSIIFFAVLAHKGSETFALAINLHRYKIEHKRSTLIITLVSLMTPLGIFITTQIGVFLHNSSGQLTTAILNSLAAATFLYLGTVHVIAEPDHIICRCGILALLSGVILMAAVAIWV